MGTKVEKMNLLYDYEGFKLVYFGEYIWRQSGQWISPSLWAMYNGEILSMEYYTAVKRNGLNQSGVSKPQTIG